MSLADLLNQATPGGWIAYHKAIKEKRHRSQIATVSPFYGSESDARLIALAPEMARLLIDATDVLRIQYMTSQQKQLLGTTESLLARFAALDAKAGVA